VGGGGRCRRDQPNLWIRAAGPAAAGFFLGAGQSKADASAAIDGATRRGIGLILLSLCAAIYAAWAGGRNLIRRPIEELLSVTAEWRNGNYNARARLEDRSSEIGRLGTAFDEMAERLAARLAVQQKAEEELRQLNATLESRIEQRILEWRGQSAPNPSSWPI
jgi:two-component system, sensor histidine kinase